MAGSFGAVRRSLAPRDQRLFEQWRETNAQYATLLFRGPEKIPPEKYRELLGQLKGKAASLEGELSQRSAEFRRQVDDGDGGAGAAGDPEGRSARRMVPL